MPAVVACEKVPVFALRVVAFSRTDPVRVLAGWLPLSAPVLTTLREDSSARNLRLLSTCMCIGQSVLHREALDAILQE